MENIELDGIPYGFVTNFKDDRNIRQSFNKLAEVTFGINFENWYQNGFWADNYIPYSLMHDNTVVSNVSVNLIEFIIEDDRKLGVQIGTVMTDEKYRHRGLNKFLMNRVISDWKERSDFIYLFANDSVLNFYPKFDFEIIDQYQFSRSSNTHNSPSLKRLNMDDENDRAFLLETVNMSLPVSKISMINNASLIMFYCLSSKKNSIFYIEKLGAIVVADFKGETVYLHDVYSKRPVELTDIIQSISGTGVKKIVLGFTPPEEADYKKSLLNEGDTLFVLDGKLSYFKDNYGMFPVLSHA